MADAAHEESSGHGSSTAVSPHNALFVLEHEAAGFMTASSSGSNVGALANVSAHIFHTLNTAYPGSINWCGWYLANNTERCLDLGPFQGRTAVSRISFDKGVCGTSARLQQSVVVADVHAFPGHIACDAASNRCSLPVPPLSHSHTISEVVIPVFCGGGQPGALAAVLDIDSPLINNFSPELVDALKKVCAAVGVALF